MSYYWTYYLVSFLAAFAIRNPWAAGLALAFFVIRRWLPDPVVLFRTLSRVGKLSAQASLNPANIVARRDLGRAYLDLLRPRTALRYLDEARTRDPHNTEIAYLRGQALLKIGDDEAALAAFGEAVGVGEGGPVSSGPAPGGAGSHGHFSAAYLGAAVALERLGRMPQAEEALTTCVSWNSSAIEPMIRLARVRRIQRNDEGARAALADARRTWQQLPGFMRRRQLSWGF